MKKTKKRITRKRKYAATIKRWKGSAYSVTVTNAMTPAATIKRWKGRVYSVTVSNAMTPYDEATTLIQSAIPKQHLENKSFQFGPMSLEKYLMNVIVASWKRIKPKPFDILSRSANSECTQEVIENILAKLSEYLHINMNIQINEPKLIANQPHYTTYISSITNELSNDDKQLNLGAPEYIAKIKHMKFVEIANILATGFMDALAKTWVEPENWMELKIRPTAKVGQIDRFMCKKTDNERTKMNATAKTAHANKIIHELLGPDYK